MGEPGYLLQLTATGALWLPSTARIERQARIVARFTCLEEAARICAAQPGLKQTHILKEDDHAAQSLH